ncbi:MAG: hypothetical protein H6811_10260 [Phycisphaeraceae bacterium]|nr:hypothetical protein [Phycisphaeraceae bacterium]
MPIDPRELGHLKGPTVIEDDRPCGVCDYNLKGLTVGAACPECGTTIRGKGGRAIDRISDAPIGYLKNLRFGLWLLVVGMLASTASLFVFRFRETWMSAGASVVAAAAWWVGVIIATEPRKTPNRDPRLMRRERRILRRINRITQAGWLAASVLMLIYSAVGGFSARVDLIFGLAALCFNIVALAGLITLCVHLSDLAHWASQDELTDRLHLAAWGIGVFGSLLLITPFAAVMPKFIAVLLIPAIMAYGLIFLGFVISEILVLVSVLNLLRTVIWTIRHWAQVRDTDARKGPSAPTVRRAWSEPVALRTKPLPGAVPPPPPPPPTQEFNPYELEPET